MAESKGGRARSEAARQSILAATRQILAAKGYDGLTIEGVAAKAGVGKQTIYRWWASKGALVAECIADEAPAAPLVLALPDTGNVQVDLEDWLNAIVDGTRDANQLALIRGLIAASAESPLVSDRMYSQITGRAERAISDRLVLVAGSSPESAKAATRALLGTFIYSVLSNQVLDQAAVRDMAALVVRGLVSSGA